MPVNRRKTPNTDCQCEKLIKNAECKIENLNTEVINLKADNQLQLEMIESYKTQLISRDREIDRLVGLLKNGRSYQTLSQECCYKNIDGQVSVLSTKVTELQKENSQLQTLLSDAVLKQHEAMKNAVLLADKNRKLEDELLEIDRMALTVESDCNTQLKRNSEKVIDLQSKLNQALSKIYDLEHQYHKNEAECNDKQKIQDLLDKALDENSKMTDKINQYVIIEHDLNIEVDRLTKSLTNQQRRIDELEALLSEANDNIKKSITRTSKQPIVIKHGDYESSYSKNEQLNTNKKPNEQCKCTKDKILADNETINNCLQTIKRLQDERDFYCQEYQRYRTQNEKTTMDKTNITELRRQLNDNEVQLVQLQQEVRDLSRAKHDLQMKLDEFSENDRWLGGANKQVQSTRATVKKMELELELAKSDICRLQEERDDLRERLKISADMRKCELQRFDEIKDNYEKRLKQLEEQRHEYIMETGSRGATISKLQNQCFEYKNRLDSTETELIQLRTIHEQLKTLHDQTDLVLSEIQSKQKAMDEELRVARLRVKQIEQDNCCKQQELIDCRNELMTTKMKLNEMDKEKDAMMLKLDDKTEECEQLCEQLKQKSQKIELLENEIASMKKDFSLKMDEIHTKEASNRCVQNEIKRLKKDLEIENKSREATLAENRRLQTDLANVQCDLEIAEQKLGSAQHEIDDLKLQLQQYVSEVGRIEDILNQKEKERNEMLDHFRQLSHEATVLENNNSSLEHEASAAKSELSRLNDQIMDMQTEIDSSEMVAKSYQNQIAGLTNEVARLECLLQEAHDDRKRCEDFNKKLEKQKETLLIENSEKESYKCRLECELKSLRNQYCEIQNELSNKIDKICSMEDQLKHSRQEYKSLKMKNERLCDDIQSLQNTIERLQTKINLLMRSDKTNCECVSRISAEITTTSNRPTPRPRNYLTKLSSLNNNNNNNESLHSNKLYCNCEQTPLTKSIANRPCCLCKNPIPQCCCCGRSSKNNHWFGGDKSKSPFNCISSKDNKFTEHNLSTTNQNNMSAKNNTCHY